MAVPLPPDEFERLQLLHSLQILDTPPEPIFDQITRLAAHVLDVPIALISLMDAERQWFKSCIGIDAAETPREQAFCAHTILQSEPMIVPDAKIDDRFCNNPFVTDSPNIRFYAGVPIRSMAGLALGTLCAIDDEPRQLSPTQLAAMRDLADIAAKEVHQRETLVLARAQVDKSRIILEKSEARFRSMFELAAVGIALVAPDGSFISVNDALCQIVGYKADELVRLTFKDITHPDDLSSDLALLRQLTNSEITNYQMEKRYRHKNGDYFWIGLNLTKKIDDNGKLEYFVAIIRNIHKRKIAEEALAHLQRDLEKKVVERTAELNAVIDQANDGYFSINEAGEVMAWNRHAAVTFGWSADEGY